LALRKWVADNWRASDYPEGCKAYAERRRVKEAQDNDSKHLGHARKSE